MERTNVLKTGKYISIILMILSGIIGLIATMKGYLTTQDWGEIILALGLLLTAVRAYLKDHYGMM